MTAMFKRFQRRNVPDVTVRQSDHKRGGKRGFGAQFPSKCAEQLGRKPHKRCVTDSNHLHFEVRIVDSVIDPLIFLPQP